MTELRVAFGRTPRRTASLEVLEPLAADFVLPVGAAKTCSPPEEKASSVKEKAICADHPGD